MTIKFTEITFPGASAQRLACGSPRYPAPLLSSLAQASTPCSFYAPHCMTLVRSQSAFSAPACVNRGCQLT